MRVEKVIAITVAAIDSIDRLMEDIDDYSFTVDLKNSWVSIPFS